MFSAQAGVALEIIEVDQTLAGVKTTNAPRTGSGGRWGAHVLGSSSTIRQGKRIGVCASVV
ncbi:MAG TPA: hypothetical protein VFY54_23945 [Rubrobacter sp.]|nr:hypothetical protein [Rubrobacter sp.]